MECEEYFSTLLEMTVWGNGFIPRSVQRICLESATSVTSSRAKPSIFLAHRYSAVCVIAENGNASAKGIRKRGKGEIFCERSKKEQSARKISRCARNDGGGMGLFHVAYNGYVGKALLLYRHPERSRGIFLAHWYSVLCETVEKGNSSVKGAKSNRVQKGFLATLEMTVWCISPYVRQRKRGNLLRRKQERAECKEDFSTAPLMTVGKAADSMNLRF